MAFANSSINMRGGPGHPVKYTFHRSSFDLGPYYRNIIDWQFEKTKPLHRKNLLAHFGCVNAIEFSRDGRMLVSGGDDRRVLLWNVDKAIVSKEEAKVMQAEHLSNVFSLDFSSSGTKIISSGNDDQVIVHDVATLAPLDYFVHEQPVYAVSADPVNESVFCSACDDGRILIFDIRESGNDPFCLAKVTSAFHSVMFHPVEPRLIITANSKEGVASWDVRMPKRVLVKYGIQNSNQCCMSARFNKMGSQILVLRRRLPPILYATNSPGHLYQFNHRGYYNSCTMKSCSFAGQHDQYVLSGSDNFDLHLWKIPSSGSDQWVNKADMVLRGHRSIVNQVRYNYTHNVIASSGVEKIVKLWSPFPMPDEAGGKSPTVVTNESERRIYSPDDYVSLVMQAGQGHFMSLTHEAGRKTTREDSRMLAFFDALVQRDINGLSDEDSDNFPETSYTNTIYTTPETSSSENEDEDSNPPNFRSHLPAGSNNISFSRITSNITREELRRAEPEITPTHVSTTDDTGVNPEEENHNNQSSLQTPADDVENEVTNNNLCPDELNEQTEDRDMTANMITQLILKKENSRRKLLSKPNSTTKSAENTSSSDSDSSSSEQENINRRAGAWHRSTSRPLEMQKSKMRYKMGKSKVDSRNLHKKRNEFRKKLLRARRREIMSTPVYESSSKLADANASSATSYDRINALMTRNQIPLSDSSLDSSSSSSSDSSSSEDCEMKDKSSVMKELSGEKPETTGAGISSSDSSSSSSNSEVSNDEEYSENSNDVNLQTQRKPSTSHSAVRDVKRKRRPPCKLNEACKAFFKQYMDNESETHAKNEEICIPSKRFRLEKLESPSIIASSAEPNAAEERVAFKKTSRNKDRNYRKVTAGLCNTPPDSGIDISKEPEPCSSKTFSCTMTNVLADSVSSAVRKCNSRKTERVDDPGFGQVESDEESN